MRIVWRGNFDLSGFGRAAIDYVSALRKLGVDIKIINTSPPRLRLVDIALNLKQLEILSSKPDDIVIQHVPPGDFIRTDSRANIGYTTFESPRIPQEWIDNLKILDGIMVPSTWNRDILIDAGIDPSKIFVIPHIVGYLEVDPKRTEPFMIRNKKTFSFLSIIDFTYRKGWDLLFEAFWTEFRADEDVSLILKTYNRSFGKDDRSRIFEYIDNLKRKLKLIELPHTMIYEWPIHSELIPSLYKSCQAYVFPTRGEGFSLTCAEAMALEVPVIATHYGGHTDYMNYSNSTLIKFTGFSTMTKEQLNLSPQYESLPLVQPSLIHLRESMRHVYVHYDEAIEKAVKGRKDIAERFSEIKIGVQLLEAIEKIAK